MVKATLKVPPTYVNTILLRKNIRYFLPVTSRGNIITCEKNVEHPGMATNTGLRWKPRVKN